MEKTIGYKLFTLRRNGTIGSLFINRRFVVPYGVWLEAEDHPTKGYAHRPGWHVLTKPDAPHLSMKGRVWRRVVVEDFEEFTRPMSQGGRWWLAKRIMVLPD